ncbi:zinc transporter 2-like isoform X2 [Anopheles albimanus]|uniref:zinc transporter 2-like isoform X2 n=1 Tax=Anopheles albimanus TaxID=7167 RepID=UPI0016404CA5|nr:zinc transporter 2-like isoform X2 [Anopheles albimanus]
MDKDDQKQPLVIEFRKNYGTSASVTATASSLEPGSTDSYQQQQQHQQQPQPHQLQQQRSIIYCVHGQLADSCCELANELSIRKIDSHCHKPRTEGIDKIARKKLIMASMLCIIFMIAEIIGGIYSNSLAIATDAAHLMADLASFMISLLALWIAARPSTKRLSFGWYRAEVIGALISVLMIWVVTAILFYMAVLRTINRDFELDGEVMLITSGLGILVNVIMGATLHHHGHSHGGGGSSTHSHEEENINVRAAFIHVLSDFVQSLGVFIAALVIYFKPEWNIIDPICTFLFSVLVLGTTIAIMKDAIVNRTPTPSWCCARQRRPFTPSIAFSKPRSRSKSSSPIWKIAISVRIQFRVTRHLANANARDRWQPEGMSARSCMCMSGLR